VSDRPRPQVGWTRSAVAALAAVVAALLAGELAAALLSVPSPVTGVAGAVIDGAPKPVKDWAIATFGTADKLALGIGIWVLLVVAGTLTVRASARRPWLRPAVVVALAGVGILAADSTEDGGAAPVPAVVAAAVAGIALWWLRPSPAAEAAPETEDPTGADLTAEPTVPEPTAEPMPAPRYAGGAWPVTVDRRRFLARAATVAAGGTVAGAAAWGLRSAADRDLRRAANATRLPRPRAGTAAAAPEVPAGASVGRGVEPFITPTDAFYRIDTAFSAPRVDLDSWRLTIDGAVDTPLTLTYEQLLEREVVERVVTLTCVSNEVGGDLVGTARWLGVPLAALLEEAGVRSGGEQVFMTSVDGWTCGFPTEIALDGRDALVAVGMNGEPLPVDHGFPARIVVPGLYGYVSATKWVERIQLVGWDQADGYWIPRGWSKEGPIKTQSRIDVPRRGKVIDPGPTAIAGVAWAQHRGIEAVEVRVDDGPWQAAELGDEVTIDAWRQWYLPWTATSGTHRIAVRATDRDGRTQPERRKRVDPDGAEGWHTVTIEVR